MKFKYNGKNVVLICSCCGAVIKYKKDFSKEENDAYLFNIDCPPQYCEKCKENGKSIS